MSLGLHVAFFLAVGLASACTSRDDAVDLRPVEFTVVLPPEDEDEPEELPEPEKPKEEEPPPQLDDKLDAVEKIVEPPKPPEPPKKPDPPPKPPEPKPKPKVVIKPPDPKNIRRVDTPKPKPLPNVPRSPVRTNQPVADLETIRRALAMGARAGTTTSLPANDDQRCVSVIYQKCRDEWEQESFNWYAGLKPGKVKIDFKAGGSGQVASWRLTGSTGSPEVDNTIRRAMNRIRNIPGLTPAFVKAYPSVNIEFTPRGR